MDTEFLDYMLRYVEDNYSSGCMLKFLDKLIEEGIVNGDG